MNPAGPPSAKPEISAMSVVGTTFGIGENATRPATASAASAAIRATICDGGFERSYQTTPATRASARSANVAASQLIALLPRARASA
jgi:hypothetical protein